MATLAADLLGLRRKVIDDNLRIAFPDSTANERRDLAWEMWRHLFLMVAEIAHAPRKLHRSNWRRWIHVEHDRQVAEFLLDSRPSVIVSGHFGNFELSGYMLGLFGFPTFTVARPLDNRYLHDFVTRFRSATGQIMLDKQGSAAEIDRQLARGASLGVLGDQAAGPKGCWVDFFGKPASTHKAIALFSLANDAPIAVGYARRSSGPMNYVIGLESIVDPADRTPTTSSVAALSQWYSRRLEALVRTAPEQYWWVHRRWKGAPPERRRRAA
jgi:KDO2-lipid IV(A) lauroyltransferase